MQLVDHVFIFLLFVAQPIQGALESRYYRAQAEAGQPFDRVRFFRQTAAVEWLFLLLLLAAWLDFGRSLADLGFVLSTGPGFVAGAAFCIVMVIYLAHSWRGATQASRDEKEKIAASFGEMIDFLPRTKRELNNFYAVSLTAGIVEEIVYRGFVIWYLAQLMPVWGAVVVSALAFGLAHSYQGMNGAIRVALIGLAFGTLYVVTGSIWLPIIAHILLDVLQGGMIHEILRKDQDDLVAESA